MKKTKNVENLQECCLKMMKQDDIEDEEDTDGACDTEPPLELSLKINRFQNGARLMSRRKLSTPYHSAQTPEVNNDPRTVCAQTEPP
ncbi:hypothetical protein GWI33_019524 [Rhynchophorus ferrugineus]|uniref:Uncharacterized protein n=1 Tax=Rhynchophorus ferrugineus TaxID=354439 RepID=A0A834HR98_RHYFE|nr:hypothetical protein GWI33_019524 [Rhynchophorus ferrugineus]